MFWSTSSAVARISASLPFVCLLSVSLCFPQARTAEKVKQPTLSHRSKPILKIGGLQFKDLNADGELNPYEDWRLAPEVRARDLVSRMSVDEKIGLMVIGTQLMGNGSGDPGGRGCKGAKSTDGLLCETRTEDTVNMFGDPDSPLYKYPKPVVRTLPTTEGIERASVRRYIVRDNPDSVALTIWTDRVQQVAEGTRLGIPVVFTSNPRNHASTDLAFGFREASGKFSTWPGTLGLAASHDLRLISDFAHIAAQEWNATGLRAGYMYQADIATDPRWFRIDGTFGDDPVAVSAIIETIVTGFQGQPLGPGGIIMTTKHFPGGGPRDRGTDPHYVYGKAAPYPTPGSLHEYHLPSFAAAIAAGSAAIMPYYAAPINAMGVPQLSGGAKFQEVGFSYNRAIVQDLLRTEMGFKGYVNSDSGILFSMPWGESILKMDYAQRAAYAINAGVDVISDTQDVGIIKEAYTRGLISEDRISLSATRLLEPMFAIGLFEDPYRDPAAAKAVVDTSEHLARAYQAHQQSVVLLKNSAALLPLTDEKLIGKAVFLERLGQPKETDELMATLQKSDPAIRFTRNLDEANLALVFVNPNDKRDRRKQSFFDLELHEETGVDIGRLKMIESKVPTVVSVNLEMPWLLGNIEPNAKAIVAAFSTRPDAVLDVLRGRFRPTSSLPITLPRNIDVVVAAETTGPKHDNSATGSDVPGFARPAADNYVYKDSDGSTYITGFGLHY
jgi:beta-glucosidase